MTDFNPAEAEFVEEGGKVIRLRPYQREWVKNTADVRAKGFSRLLLDAVGGSGKCLGKGTPVLMYDGTVKPVESVIIGDLLMGPDSTPRIVSSTCTGTEPLYRVNPVKGDSYVVNESHILSLKATCGKNPLRHKDRRYMHGEVLNVSVTDFLAERKAFHHSTVGWRAAVDFEPTALHPHMPPYMLGLWLGDGNSDKFAISKPDKEVYDAVKEYADSIGHFVTTTISKSGGGTCETHSVVSSHTRGMAVPGGNVSLNTLRALNLIDNKHIPHSYKASSRSVRLSVLAGVLDADGCLTNGCIDYITISKKLVEDVAFVARSVGLSAYIKPCKKGCQNGFVGDYFRLSISGDIDMIPFRIPRRKPPPRKQIKNVLVTGIKLEPIGIGEYFGFTLEGPDKLFLLGDFTVTHNTSYAAFLARQEWDKRQGRTLILETRQQLVMQTAQRFRDESGLEVDVEMSDRTASPYAQVVVASVATLGRINRLTAFADNHFAIVFADEAHESTANLFLRVMRYFHYGAASLAEDWVAPKDGEYQPKACIIGITATPDTHGKRNLGNFYQNVPGGHGGCVARYSYLEAISDGWLVGLKEINIPCRVDCRKFRRKATGHGTDFSTEDETAAIIPIIEELADQIVTHASTRKTMCFLPSKECVLLMTEALNRKGLRSLYVLGDCIDGDAKTEEFRNSGPGICLALCAMYVQGTDFHDVDTVAWFRATLSPSFYKQGIYRCSRTLKDCVTEEMGEEGRRAAIAASKKPWSLVISPFFVSDSVDIMSVTDLFVDQSIKGSSKKSPPDMTDAAKIRDFIAALEKAADKHRNKQPRTIDPVRFGLSIGVEAIANYRPENALDAGPPSKAELDYLLQAGCSTVDVKTSGEAQLLVKRLQSRERLGLATPRTIHQLTLELKWPKEIAMMMKQKQAGFLMAKRIEYVPPKEEQPVIDGF